MPHFPHLVLFAGDSPSDTAPSVALGVPHAGPKHKRAVTCLTEKIPELRPSPSYSALGREFSVHESTIYKNNTSLARNTQNEVTDGTVGTNVMTRGFWETHPVFPPRTIVQYLLIHRLQRLLGHYLSS